LAIGAGRVEHAEKIRYANIGSLFKSEQSAKKYVAVATRRDRPRAASITKSYKSPVLHYDSLEPFFPLIGAPPMRQREGPCDQEWESVDDRGDRQRAACGADRRWWQVATRGTVRREPSPGGGFVADDEDLKAEVERLKAENAQLKTQRGRSVSLKVSEKGGVSVYGLGRFPVTLYKEQWTKLLAMSEEIRAFIKENDAALKTKPE
jgi:hypothetical protein